MLPHALVSDIQQFIESDYAKKYFSEHRTGFIFRRRIPMEQLMTWQKVNMQLALSNGRVLTGLHRVLYLRHY